MVVISIKRLTIWFTTAFTLNPKRQYQRPLGTVPTTSILTSSTVPQQQYQRPLQYQQQQQQ